ncbi:hypothetical protein QTP88_028247 [Uroleucon formosanum]
MLAKISEPVNEWDKVLYKVEFAINNTVHRSTRQTPSRLLFGINQVGDVSDELRHVIEEINENRFDLPEIRKKVSEQIMKAQTESEKQCDVGRKEPVKYNVGDYVMIKNVDVTNGVNKKLIPKFKGPYIVRRALDYDRYVIGDIEGNQITQRPYEGIVGPDQMKRQEVIDSHLTKSYHTISLKMLRLSTLPNSIVQQSTQMGRDILKANEKLGNKIGSLMIHTYGEAKKLTLKTISMSLHCDGSVDRSQIDKIYIILKTVSLKGVEEQYFLGAGQVEQRGAEGILDAIETACINNVGHDVTEYIFKNISSIVTDGAAVNIGSEGGLWTLVENKWRNNSNKSNVPLIKIWCAVHWSNLAWKDVNSTVVEVSHIVNKLSGISAFFHNSALRTRELQQLSKENNLQLIRIPKFFQVRWTEFSFSLVNAILI